ncbi:MAG: FAD:protein FMN transferase [Pseudonocardiaceae bacterium]
MNSAGPAPAEGGPEPARVSFPAIGTTALLLLTDPQALPEAHTWLRAELAALDAACSRFRPDSELAAVEAAGGAAVPVSPLLAAAIETALRAAARTDGLVDPTVGQALCELGYDRDFAALPHSRPDAPRCRPAPGWWRVGWDPASRRCVLPRGVRLDLGATAKALAADRAADSIARWTGSGVLVSLGGDIAVAGPAPAGGWRVRIGPDHTCPGPDDTVVSIVSGALATSSTGRRRWDRGGRTVHHIVDPRTGDVPAPVWRTVSVAAGSCVDANTASTASIVLGEQSPEWLDRRGLPARLVGEDGRVRTVAGWPAPPADREPEPPADRHRARIGTGG